MAMAQDFCSRMMIDVIGLNAVVLATVDGFEAVHAIRNDLKPERLAALASSIAAIGQVVALEGSLGQSKRIIIDAEHGYTLVCSVPRQDIGFVLILLSDTDALLGQLNVNAIKGSQFFANLQILP